MLAKHRKSWGCWDCQYVNFLNKKFTNKIASIQQSEVGY